MAKKLLFNDDARQALKKGIDAAAGAVKVTIGPKGRNVALDKGFGGPTITNDGISIVKEISLADKFENMGVEIVKEVADKTNKIAGDGTSTATVLLDSIVTEGMKYMQSGLEIMGVQRGVNAATAEVIAALKSQSKEVSGGEEIKQVATISAESEEMGAIIAETIEKVGQDGVVTVEESQNAEMYSEVVEGMQFDRGYISPYMITDGDRMEAVYKDPAVLVYDKEVSAVKDVLPLLEKLAASGRKDLVIIAEDVKGEALTTFVVNKLRGTFNVLAVKAPGFGDRRKAMLEDIAIVTGATLITEDKGMRLEDAGLEHLGKVAKIVSTKDKTTLVDGAGSKNAIEERVTQLKAQLDQTTATFDKEKLSERIAKLAGGIAVIKVGAATETEMKYLKLKIEDAVNATKAAIEEGVVAGGGSALVTAAATVRKAVDAKEFKTQEEKIGYSIVLNACEGPLRQIAINCGNGDGSITVEKVKELGGNGGYNAVEDVYVADMLAAGIIDPVKVTRTALLNAASAAGTFLTTQVAIADEPEESGAPMGMPAGAPGMGGMGF